MKIPNYLFEEFVDNNILNTGFSAVLTSMQEFASTDQLFVPGVINPHSLTFAFHANLTVTATAGGSGDLQFKILFGTGALTGGFGTTNGTTNSAYTVNFAGLVPGIGSVTAYIVAQYTQIQLNSTVILGAPPGHPDYSANFVPYTGYTTLQDTLTIFATTTAPDNDVTFELARTTLTAGQTQVITVDTSHQQLAGLNINPSNFGIAGDVTGILSNTIVQRSSAATFGANNINAAGNITAAAVTAAGSIIAGADLLASLDIGSGRDVDVGRNLGVNGLATILGSATVGGTLGVGGIITGSSDVDAGGAVNAGLGVHATNNVTAGGFVSAGGEVFGANASVANAAVMLGQLLGSTFNVVGPNTAGYFHIPVWTGSSFIKYLIQFGSYQAGASTPAGNYTAVYPISFTGISGNIYLTTIGGAGATVNNGSQTLTQFGFNVPVGCIAVYWLSIGQ